MTIEGLPYYVYICWWDNGWGYVGHSDNPKARKASHAKNKKFAGKIVDTEIVNSFSSKEEAWSEEKNLISKLFYEGYDLYNEHYNPAYSKVEPKILRRKNERGDNMKTKTAKVSKGTAAANAAWVTRRANAAAQKRSDAARKAWATRRAQG